jgi:hypothetical protein
MIKVERRTRDEKYEDFGKKAKTKQETFADDAEASTSLDSVTAYDKNMSATEYAELLEEEMYA